MHLKPQADMKVVKKEEKEAQLTAYIAADLEQRAAHSSDKPTPIQIVARSLESPVVCAITRLAPELSKAGVTVQIVLSAIDNPVIAQINRTHDGATAANTITTQTRVAHDPRLFDAHEQLVLSGTCVWVGDIMRREPAKRDAFENYSTNCETTARWVHQAFNRLWAASKPAPAISLGQIEPSTDGADFAQLAGAVGNATEHGATAGTRH